MKKIAMIVGAGTNFMKVYPVYLALKEDFEITLIHTGQHFDTKMSDVFFNQLNFPKSNIHFEMTEKTRAGDIDSKLYVNNKEYLLDKKKVIEELKILTNIGQLGEIRDKLTIEFKKIQPDLIIVFGDVIGTLAGALAGLNLNIEVAHIESGLRSFDLEMPEEVNRILTDSIANYLFVTEQSCVDNLKQEGITNNVYLVGNTMIDCLMMFKDRALGTKYQEVLGTKEKEYVLITLHRPSNVDNLDKLKEIINDVVELSKTEKIIFPLHPQTKKNIEKLEINLGENIILCEPLGYLEFTCLEANAKYVITDSGGIQDETSALGVPCFTLRENTERPNTLIENEETNILVKKIFNCEIYKNLNNNNMNNYYEFCNKKIYIIIKNTKKNVVIFMDCHGLQIYEYLKLNNQFGEKFNLEYISLNNYVVKNSKYFNYDELSDTDINLIKKADIFILQVIEKDRKFLNNTNVIRYCKDNIKILKIPHYRNSVYSYKIIGDFFDKSELSKNWYILDKIKDINNVDETINTIKNEIEIMNNLYYDKKKLEECLIYKLKEFENIDKMSDIKMNNFFIENYKKIRLFNGRSYPSSIFFYELTNKILQELNIFHKEKFIDLFFAENTGEPIPDYWYNHCQFKFHNVYYVYGHIPVEEYEWYYMILISKDINICDKKKNISLLEFIRKK